MKPRETSLGDALEGFFKKSGLTNKMLIVRTLRDWPKFAGKPIAEQTERLRYEKGELIVYMKSPIWRQELLYRKTEIVTAINVAAGQQIIRDLRVFAP
ncbi:MAG: DUF721 domain-containing protein [Bacteroidota bacterium]